MADMKKKIQLVEGERKAVFEDCEREKQENQERIRSASNTPTHLTTRRGLGQPPILSLI
jgi:hypothetical protein